MKDLLIVGFKSPNSEGVSLEFNKPFALGGGMAAKVWWVSWDKIGTALCGDDYCQEDGVAERNKIRGG